MEDDVTVGAESLRATPVFLTDDVTVGSESLRATPVFLTASF